MCVSVREKNIAITAVVCGYDLKFLQTAPTNDRNVY